MEDSANITVPNEAGQPVIAVTETPIVPVVSTPPPADEGVPNTKKDSTDDLMTAFFGKEAFPKKEELVTEEIGSLKVTMTKPDGPSANPLDQPVVVETPTVETSAVETPVITATYTQEQVDSMIATRVEEEVQKFQAINTFFDEYQKDPYAYMAKYSPHLFEKFNEGEYIQTKLEAEFGKEFIVDASRAFQYGTTDYNYRIRQEELVREAQSLKTQARDSVTQQQSKIEQDEQEYKTTKAKALGLDLPSFETKVWSKLKSMDDQMILDMVIDAVIYKEKLTEKSANIKTQIDLTKAAPSPVNVPGTGGVVGTDKDAKMIMSLFGPK